jgi:hypothetical protein
MKKFVLLYSLLGCLLLPIVASATMNRDPPTMTEFDLLGNISLDGAALLLLAGNEGFVSIFTIGDDTEAWDQFDLADINLGKYLQKGQGKFEIAELNTYNWGDSGIGNSATRFFLDFREDIGKMITHMGDYNFQIQGNRNHSILSNFEPLMAAQPVPEPSTISLLLIGSLGLIAFGRKSKSPLS